MLIIKKVRELTAVIASHRNNGYSIGFVPTMGALHAGHLSLLSAARRPRQLSVASIFVNPAQFNDPADFEKYPVTIENDIVLLEKSGCDILFLPTVAEIYPAGWSSPAPYDLGFLETVFEGSSRPGHFQGVCRVMERLLSIVGPDNLYMGQKDYQQCMVVGRLLNLMSSACSLHTCPTLREADGLAMSSRNMRLDAEARKRATGIYQALCFLKAGLRPGPTDPILDKAKKFLDNNAFKTDYLSIADARTLAPVQQWDGLQPVVALAAAWQKDVRLIDNMVLTETRQPIEAGTVIS